MSKELKSFHKLFFVIIFSILFSGIVGSTNTPDLPDKIAPELEKIEALPRRTKPAELNIEVTKIKTEALEELYIDRKNKIIYVDFSKKKQNNLAGVRDAQDLDQKYSLLISEAVQGSGQVVGKQKTKAGNTSQLMSYEVAEIKGKKMLKIPYENEPEKLYISVQENSKGETVKVYSMDIKEIAPVYNPNDLRWSIEGTTKEYYDQLGMVLPTGNQPLVAGSVSAWLENSIPQDFPWIFLGSPGFFTGVTDPGTTDVYMPESPTPLEIKYISSQTSLTFILDMYFTDLVFTDSDRDIQRRVTGTTNKYTSAAAYRYGASEKISAKLVGQTREGISTNFLEILKGFRNSTETEWRFFDSTSQNLRFIQGTYEKGELALKTGVSAGTGAAFVEFKKKNSAESLVLTLSNNENYSIPFTGTGVNITGATLTNKTPGSTPYYLRSLGLTPTNFTLNGGTPTAIDASGNSSQAEVTLTNGSNELKLGVKYNGEYPTLTILNTPRKGTYTLNIKHYEPSGLERLDYTLDIVIEKDYSSSEILSNITGGEKKYYDQPGMVLPTGTQTITISSIDAWMKEAGDTEFAWIFLGDLTSGGIKVPDAPGDPDYSVPVYMPESPAPIEINFKNDKNSLNFNMDMYFNDLDFVNSQRDIQRKVAGTTDKYTSAAAYTYGTDERVSAKLVAQPEANISAKFLAILQEFRASTDTSWNFYDSKQSLKVIKGDYESGNFIGYAEKSKNTGSAIFYFEKKNAAENLELKLSDNKNYSIPFTGTGVNITGATLTNKTPGSTPYYLRSLGLTPTNFTLNGGTPTTAINALGNSSQAEVTLTNGSNELKLGVKYNGEYPTLTILNTPRKGTYTLNIKHYEPSGLERLDYTLDIVIEKDYQAYSETQILYNLKDAVIEDKPGISIDATPEFPLGSLGIDEYGADEKQFPFMALGKQSPINDPNRESWAFNLTSAELGKMETRKSVITAYKNSDFSKELNMNMWFSNAVDIQGATKILKSQVIGSNGTRYNFLAAYGDNSSEKIKANDVRMKVDSSSSGIITEIINEFRKSTVKEWKFESKDLEQIAFGLGEYDATGDRYKVYDQEYSKNYPSIIFRKIDVAEELTLTITKDVQWYSEYVPASKKFLFTKDGVELLPHGTTLSSGTYYLRNLGLGGNSSYSVNGGEKIQIDSSGSSKWVDALIKLDTDRELEIGGRYVNGNFELTVFFYGKLKAGTYPLNIKLYEQSGLERANYTLNILVPEDIYADLSGGFLSGTQSRDDYLDMPGMQLPTGADIEIGSVYVGQYYEGTVDPNIERFPFMVMGSADFGFTSNEEGLSKLAKRGPIYTTYSHLRKDDDNIGTSTKEIKMEVYLNDPYFVNAGVKLIRESAEGRMNFIGALKKGKYLEKIEAKMRGIIQPESSGVLLEILKEFRQSPNMFWAFYSKDARQFHMSGGEFNYSTGLYTVKDIRTRSSSNLQYPYLGFRKSKLSEDLTLTVSDDKFDFSGSIVFTGSGINVPGAILSSGTLYMRSLGLTPSSFSLNGGAKNVIDSSGNSAEANVTLNNGTSNLELNIKYNNEYPTFKILNKPNPGIYSLKMLHYEESGMVRLTYNLNIVIEAEKEFEVTSSMEDIVIKPPTSIGESATVQYPDNWVKVVQLVKTKEKFPVIGVNKPKWVIGTDRPLNPRAERPLAALNLKGETITVPVNIKETPYQNVEKFFVYDRGDMTNRNLAVGAYTDLSSINGSGTNNQVKVNFEMFLEKEHIDKILAYASSQAGDKIEIPYASSQDPTIYSIRGLQSSASKKFTVNEANILSYGIVPFPKIVVLKGEIVNKNLEIDLQPSYTDVDKIKFDSGVAPVYDSSKVVIRPSNDNAIMEGLNSEHIIRLTLPNGIQKDYITKPDGSFLIEETIEKSGKTMKLHINYISSSKVELWVSDRTGAQEYDLVLQHLDLSGDVRKTINMRIASIVTSRTGEMDFVISSRYNPAQSGLNSNPLAITSNGIVYEKQVLDLNLLTGNYPEAPGTTKEVYVNNQSLASLSGGQVTLTNGTVLRITKESNGDLKIKPLYWKYGATDVLNLSYKTSGTVTDEYTFNIKCPNFFVASMGELDFGRIYKSSNNQDVPKTTNIELQYNVGSVKATYSLDVSQADSDGTMSNSLYLNDEKTLLVKDLYLGDEVINTSDNTKRTIPLRGTIDGPSVKNTPEGTYQKTIQILIHLQ